MNVLENENNERENSSTTIDEEVHQQTVNELFEADNKYEKDDSASARSVGHAEAGSAKTASQLLLAKLEKKANESFTNGSDVALGAGMMAGGAGVGATSSYLAQKLSDKAHLNSDFQSLISSGMMSADDATEEIGTIKQLLKEYRNSPEGARGVRAHRMKGALGGGIAGIGAAAAYGLSNHLSNSGSVGHEEAGLAQTASNELLDSLEKEAAKKYLGDLSGKNLKKAKQRKLDADANAVLNRRNFENHGANRGEHAIAKREREQANADLFQAQKNQYDSRRIAAGIGGAALVGGAGGAVAMENKKNNEKVASTHEEENQMTNDLMASLEKTANESLEVGRLADETADAAILGGLAGANIGILAGAIPTSKRMDALDRDINRKINFHEVMKGEPVKPIRAGLMAGRESLRHSFNNSKAGALRGAGIGAALMGTVGAMNALNDGDDNLEQEQTASESLMNSLEKEAAGAFGATMKGVKGLGSKVKNFTNDATGKNYRAYSKEVDGLNLPGNLANQAKAQEKSIMRGAQVKAGIGAAGVATGIAGANALAPKQEKEASTLLESLEKTAKIKHFANHLTGKNVKESNRMVGEAKKLEEGASFIPKGTFSKDLKKQRNKDAAKMVGAQGAVLGGAAAAGAGAHAAASANKEKTASEASDVMEKTASEQFMDELYKEAATAILSSHIPEVKEYNDPIDRIKF